MSDFIEQEEILKSYDAALMRRLLTYLKPYLFPFILSLMALFLATGSQLVMPVLIQRSIDNHILPYHQGIDTGQATQEVLDKLGPVEAEFTIEGIYYFSTAKLARLNALEKQGLRARGIIFPENYFIIRDYQRQAEMQELLAQYPGHFRTNSRHAVIRAEDLSRLRREDLRIVRRQHYQGLSSLGVIFAIALLGLTLFTFSQIYLQAQVGQMVMKDLRTKLYDHTLGLSLRFIDANPVGRLVTRIANDVETINELFTSVLSALLQDVCLMFGVLVALFSLNPRLALVTLLTLPPVLGATLVFRSRARNAFRKVRKAVSGINAFLSEHISGMRIVQLFAKEEQTQKQFDRRNDRLLRANLGEMYVFATFRPLVDLLATVSIAVILYFGARFLLEDLVSLGVLIAFLNLIRMFYQPVRDLSEKYNILQSAMAGAERVFQLLDEQSKIEQPEHPLSLDQVRGAIAFKQVSFWYKEGDMVLRDLSFQVEPGETVAIVGYTGAGKTTITSLLTRLWDIQQGAILLDGIDIRKIPTNLLRQRVQSVLQDVFLFSGTIEDNIRLGKNLPQEAIQQAVRLVRADTFIEKLPEGLQTSLQERGGNLSMGQRQLLSFARVLAHDPDVLILDEATGNIDTETEKLIQEALQTLLRDRTSLVIAHRLSTIRNADRILVLHQGQLLESGSHQALMRKQGMYFNLYQMQFLEKN